MANVFYGLFTTYFMRLKPIDPGPRRGVRRQAQLKRYQGFSIDLQDTD